MSSLHGGRVAPQPLAFNISQLNASLLSIVSTQSYLTCSGLVFVNLDMNAPPFETRFRAVDEMASKFALQENVYFAERIRDFDFNWKVYIDNYQEGYHIPVAHPKLNEQMRSDTYSVQNFDEGKFSVHSVEQSEGA